jgi:RND family efflux transporter MFP subunit
MKTKTTHLALVGTLAVLPALLPPALFATESPRASAVATSSQAPLAVETFVVQSAPRLVTEEVVGSVRTKVRSVIEAKVSGRIAAMPVILGQQVKAGTLLAEIDAREIQARLEQAEAQRDQASKDLARAQTLAEKQVSSKQEFDAAEARYKVADAALREASTMLGYAKVTAPFDGVISRRLAEVGDLAVPGKPLLEIEDRSTLRFEADVPEALIGQISGGQQLQVTVPTTKKSFPAVVVEVSPTADAASRTFLIKLDLPAAPELRAGQFGRAAVPVDQAVSIRIPTKALVRRGQMEIVFVRKGGAARLQLVKTGKTLGDEVEILAGLSDGDDLIVTDPALLLDGQSVEVSK